MKSHPTLSKALRKSKEITTRGLSSVFERSIESPITERACNIVILLIAAKWFLLIIISKIFACNFENRCVNFEVQIYKWDWSMVYSVFSHPFYMTNMTPVLELTPMVSSLFQEWNTPKRTEDGSFKKMFIIFKINFSLTKVKLFIWDLLSVRNFY